MAKKEKKKKEEVFFVGIKEPVEIRRNILEASREMVLLLQLYEKFKAVRDEKRSEMDKLRNIIREIALMVSKLKKHLPKTELRAMPLREVKKETPRLEKVHVMEVKEEEKVLKHELTELEKLEAELSSIEQKLNHLS